jgi:hypothetical protein
MTGTPGPTPGNDRNTRADSWQQPEHPGQLLAMTGTPGPTPGVMLTGKLLSRNVYLHDSFKILEIFACDYEVDMF